MNVLGRLELLPRPPIIIPNNHPNRVVIHKHGATKWAANVAGKGFANGSIGQPTT